MTLYNEYNNAVQPMKTYDCIIVGTGPAGWSADRDILEVS